MSGDLNIPAMFGSGEFADTFAEHKFLTAVLIYFLIGIIFWVWDWSRIPSEKESRVVKFFRAVFLPMSVPGFIIAGLTGVRWR